MSTKFSPQICWRSLVANIVNKHIKTFKTLGSTHVHLDNSASNFSIIHASDTGLGLLSGGEREEGKTSSRVEEVGHLSKLLSSLFEVFIFGFLGT